MYTGWEKFMFAYHGENNPPATPTEVLSGNFPTGGQDICFLAQG